jgi:predicted GTPase
MSRWRLAVLVVLIAAPFVFLAGLGSYSLYERHWGFVAWWPMTGCLALAYLLGWYWQRKNRLLPAMDFHASVQWTERDAEAWKLVEARAKAADKLSPDQLATLQFYVDTAQEMALELARAYHPGARDPVGELTIAEVLAVVELASHDMAELVDKYLPGGHLLTIRNWQQAKQATDWYRTASNSYWLITSIFAPVETGLRYAASRAGVSRPWQRLQQNLLIWFYTAYVHRVGTYLIDVNSGRLRIGATRYRQLVKDHAPQRPGADMASSGALAHAGQTPEDSSAAAQVTITVIGQVKAGKSSFINALLGEQRAFTDVTPCTNEITRYELHPQAVGNRLIVLDTVGYGHAGPRPDQLEATREAALQSDVLVLAMHARNPARQADVELLQGLARWFESRPDLRAPPILGILTHIDLLSPALEWSPPYDWREPRRPKEQQMQQALNAAKEQMNDFLAGCVPVCTAAERVHGVEEWFLPMLAGVLDEAHGVALLRCLRAEANADRIRKVLKQLLAAGTELAKAVWHSSRK